MVENLEHLSNEELSQIVVEAQRILSNRAKVEAFEADADKRLRELAEQIGRDLADGIEWAQPVGAHDSFPKGQIVTHDGKTWVSLVSGNVWEPGVSGWREVVENEDGSPGIPEWVQPSGAHDAYQTGDEVMFEGVHYRSVIDNNTWSPADYPAGWETV